MKYIFNVILIIISIHSYSYARDIVLITYAKDNKTIGLIKKIINNDVSFPKTLIRYKEITSPCSPDKKTLLHICVTSNDFNIVHENRAVLNHSFKTFFED
jgi:hypothetical protein